MVNEIWANLLAAIGWIEQRLDRRAAGFLHPAEAALPSSVSVTSPTC
jgi:hypothetical protein